MRSYKVEIKPTQEQIIKIHKTIGVCRFVYNLYLEYNKHQYENSKTTLDKIEIQATLSPELKDKTDIKKSSFVSAYSFSKYLNNVYVKENPDKLWLKEVSSKSVMRAIKNAETAYKRFFKGLSEFPKFKKKKNNSVNMYFVKNSPTDIVVQRHRIKVPTLGFIRLKRFGYIPEDTNVTSGTISCKAGHYFISILVKNPVHKQNKPKHNNTIKSKGVGIDLGIKDLAIVSSGSVFKNINKTSKEIKRLERYLKRQQRSLTRKLIANNIIKKQTSKEPKLLPLDITSNNEIEKELTVKEIKKQERIKRTIERNKVLKAKRLRDLTDPLYQQKKNKYYHLIKTYVVSKTKQQRISKRPTTALTDNKIDAIDSGLDNTIKQEKKIYYSNIEKQKRLIQVCHYKLTNKREGYNKHVVNSIIRKNPEHISIEDLSIRGLMKNRHLAKAIQKQNLYQFRQFLTQRCKSENIELRVVNRWHPSSKLCSLCQTKKSDLQLSDRVYKCINTNCKYNREPIDRDLNASYNIRDCKSDQYKIEMLV